MSTSTVSAGPRRRTGHRWTPYLFVAPFVLTFVGFGVFPMLYALALSFTRWAGAGRPSFLGFENYQFLLTNPEFWASLANSGRMWLLVIPAQLLVSLLLAVALSHKRLRAKAALRAAFILPFITPLVAMAQVWKVAFDESFGPVNQTLAAMHLPTVDWLTSETWARPTLALLFLWKTTGFVMIILLAGIQEISGDVYEAGSIDGASTVRQFIHLTLPLMRRPLVFALIIQSLAVIQMFAEPYVVTEGGPYGATTTAGYYLYQHIQISDLGTGAANSILLVIVMLALSMTATRLMREDR